MKKTDFRNIITDQDQMSEAFIVNAILAFSGGFQDAYTYITRDGVFANAQTGNIVLMSTSFLQGKWLTGVRYLGPILAFILGVLIADTVDKKWHKTSVIHWRQIVVALEIIILGKEQNTCGAYTQIGVVISACIDTLGQCKPTEMVRFQFVSMEEAIEIKKRKKALLEDESIFSYV